jgi:hypothetical protein
MSEKYILISSPFDFSIKFSETTKIQAKMYYEWYINEIQNRVEILNNYVISSKKFTNWRSDYSYDSLGMLGEWFYQNIGTRKRTEQEINQIYDKSPKWFRSIQVPENDLSYESISLCVDISMYFGKILADEIPGVHWELYKSNRKIDINYHQPVLVGQGKLVCNPFHLIKTLAYCFMDETKKSNSLIDLYIIWRNILSND